MHDRILRRMRESVRSLRYVVTAHAEEEMHDDEFTILDVERAILSGTIRERRRDVDTGGWKFVIAGWSIAGAPLEVVGRLSMSGQLIIVTVYRA